MIAASSPSIGYAYQLLYILYHGKPVFMLQFPQLIRPLSKVMLFSVCYICCGNTIFMWAQIFKYYFITNLRPFFSGNTSEFSVYQAWKTGGLFLLCHYRIHVSPFLLPYSSCIWDVPMGSRSFCRHVVGCSGRMLGFRRLYFWTRTDASGRCDEYPNLYQTRRESFCSGGNYHSSDKRYACFPGHIMAFIPQFLRSLHTSG